MMSIISSTSLISCISGHNLEGRREGGRKEAQLIGQSTDLTILRFSLRVPTRPPGWSVSRLSQVKILSAMLVSSKLYHLLPDGILKNHFFQIAWSH